MAILTEQQRNRAVEVLREHLGAAPGAGGLTPVAAGEKLDRDRIRVIREQLLPLLNDFIVGSVPLPEFKTRVDGINKRMSYWGFRGIKGQMFFNMLLNAASDEKEVDQELKTVLTAPSTESEASSRLRTFLSYVKRVGEDWVSAGNSAHGRPKPSSIPFFVSYFWQIQSPNVWPVFYTNSVQTMTDLNLWQPKDDLVDDYIAFKHIHEELVKLFTETTGRTSDLYQVEHVFWYKAGNPYNAASSASESTDVAVKPAVRASEIIIGPLDGYVPPIVANLPLIARDDPALIELAKRSGAGLPRLFEKAIDAAFTMLGFETRLLGQGKGRVPDGLAKSLDDNYAILWDGKIRAGEYSIGTDDRTIKEYITTQAREQKRNGRLRNIYYVIVSSGFSDDYDDLIRSLKMETDVNEVILVEASALVAMVDAKLRQPIQITLGPDGLQRLFTNSGVLTVDMVREELA